MTDVTIISSYALTSNHYAAMLRPLMPTSNQQPTYISRSALQWILHQALVADDRYSYRGLIGADQENPGLIQKVAMLKDEGDEQQTLSVWQDLGIQCLGYFHFDNEPVSKNLLDIMPEQHLQLSVRLSEKGRLDVLAFVCIISEDSVTKTDLDLIEDGHTDKLV